MGTNRVARLLVLLALAPAALAADTVEKAFKKQAKFTVKVVKSNVKFAVKAAKANLKSASGAYAAGTASAAEALAAAVDEITAQRDELEDGARNGLNNLSLDGQSLLSDANETSPGPDFQAGGRGTWDDAQADLDAALDKADQQLRKAFEKWAKAMVKAAGKQDLELDIRALLPDHGTTIYSVVPPAATEIESLTDGGNIFDDPPEVLILARLVETNQSALAQIGVRVDAVSVNVVAATTDSDQAVVAQLAPDETQTATGTLDLGDMLAPAGFLSVVLDDGDGQSLRVAVSAPKITPPAAGTEDVLDEFDAALLDARKALTKACSDILKALADALASHVAAVKDGVATPELALRTGWANLRTAREALGLAWKTYTQTIANIRETLDNHGFDDEDLPSGFFPDAVTVGPGDELLFTSALLRDRHDTATKAYDNFAKKILSLGAKQGSATNANYILGRTSAAQAPLVTASETPPATPLFAPAITDGLALVVQPVITPEHSILLVVQADPSQYAELDFSVTTLPAQDTSDLTDASIRQGGTASFEVPLLPDIPVLGWLFKSKNTETDRHTPLILVKPTVLPSEE